MTAPLNTGKIKIGSKYQPKPRDFARSSDELLLQRALLNKEESKVWVPVPTVVSLVLAVFLIMLTVAHRQ